MKNSASVYDESPLYTYFKSFCVSYFRPTAIRCISSIFFNFFLRQYRAAWLPGRVPVCRADHPLDLKIPFVPSWVAIYLDFVNFWIRMLSFLLHRYRRRVYGKVREFLESIGKLYAYAAEVYQKNFSTTDRPFYIARPRFLLIHLVDPHLMCIPSLHVMVVILTYTRFTAILRSFNDEERYSSQIDEVKQGALAISQAILYVKQHSVNCIAASLYAMTCFDGKLFPPEEAEAFTGLLFGNPPPAASLKPTAVKPPHSLLKNYRQRPCAAPRTKLPAEDIVEIKAHIIGMYRRFLAERGTQASPSAQSWMEPLLNFMKEMPQKR